MQRVAITVTEAYYIKSAIRTSTKFGIASEMYPQAGAWGVICYLISGSCARTRPDAATDNTFKSPQSKSDSNVQKRQPPTSLTGVVQRNLDSAALNMCLSL